MLEEINELRNDILNKYKLDNGNDKTREFYMLQALDLVINIINRHNNQPDYKSAYLEEKNMFKKIIKEVNEKDASDNALLEKEKEITLIILSALWTNKKKIMQKYNLGGN